MSVPRQSSRRRGCGRAIGAGITICSFLACELRTAGIPRGKWQRAAQPRRRQHCKRQGAGRGGWASLCVSTTGLLYGARAGTLNPKRLWWLVLQGFVGGN